MKNLLITGASGFVGINLTQYLSVNNFNVSTISLRNDIPLSIPDNINCIIHLAGKAHDLRKVAEPSEYFRINTDLTKKLFDLFIKSKATTFIFLSSVKASADTVQFELTEENIPNPATVYGLSKLQAEEYLLSKKLPDGKRLFILRPCMIHGPGNKGNLNLLYKLVKLRLPYPLASFNNKRSFLSIGNLCWVCKEFIERNEILSGIYNIADEVPLSTKEVMDIMSEVLAKKPIYLNVNKYLIKNIALLGDKIPIFLNSERLKKLTENYIVNTDKVKNVLNHSMPISSAEGVKISIRSFLGHKKN